MIKNLNKKKKGFTLVELIVVIAIIGILAAISVPKYSAYKESAAIKTNEASAKIIAEATIMAIDEGKVSSADGTITNQSTDATKWGYIDKYIGKTITSETSTDTVQVEITTIKITATVGIQTYDMDY